MEKMATAAVSMSRGNVTISNTTISDNSARFGDGGGIDVDRRFWRRFYAQQQHDLR